MSVDDFHAVSAIYDHEVLNGTSTFDTERRSPRAQQAWFTAHQNDSHPLLVAVEPPSTILGWGCLSPWSPRGAYARSVEASVFVHPGHRHHGLGLSLLGALVDRARTARHRVIIGRIEATNDSSRRMVLNVGFSSIGVMHAVGEKFGRVLDVELFELFLRDSSDPYQAAGCRDPGSRLVNCLRICFSVGWALIFRSRVMRWG